MVEGGKRARTPRWTFVFSAFDQVAARSSVERGLLVEQDGQEKLQLTEEC